MLTMTDRLHRATDSHITPPSRAYSPESTWPEKSSKIVDKSVITQPKSQEDWGKYEKTIKGLYLGENMPLHEVIEIMRKRHAFHAT